MIRKILFALCILSSSLAQDFDGNLPNTTYPESYLVIITTNVPSAAVRFTGFVNVVVKVLENTNDVYLHSRRHTGLSCTLREFEKFDEMKNVTIERENDDMIKVHSQQELQAGLSYELAINFQGSLLLVSEGFFRSDYVTNVEGSDVFTYETFGNYFCDGLKI